VKKSWLATSRLVPCRASTGQDHHFSQERSCHVGRGQQGHRRTLVHRVLGPQYNPDVIDELAAPDIRFEYSMHAPCRGRDQVRAFAARFRAAFPDLGFAERPI
jgi:hypothetical protein